MVILEKIKEICFNVATIGGLGKWRTGSFLASLLAFPLLIFDRILYDISPTLFYWFICLFLVFCWLVIYFALNFISDEYPSTIVIDKVIGMMITFAFIPLKWKLMVFGFIFFHVVDFFRPLVLREGLGRKINELPFGLGILAGDAVSGVICNLFLQLIVWLMV